VPPNYDSIYPLDRLCFVLLSSFNHGYAIVSRECLSYPHLFRSLPFMGHVHWDKLEVTSDERGTSMLPLELQRSLPIPRDSVASRRPSLMRFTIYLKRRTSHQPSYIARNLAVFSIQVELSSSPLACQREGKRSFHQPYRLISGFGHHC